jgi:hypothetical protein
MNKKMEELAEQAGFKLDELPDDIFIPLEKFAELLIRESAKPVGNLYKQGGGTWGEVILKYFDIPVRVKDKK